MDTLIIEKQCLLCGSFNDSPSINEPHYVFCRTCGLIYTSPRYCNEKLREMADYWACKHHLSLEKIEADFSEFTEKLVYFPRMQYISMFRKNNRILDIGCATGGWLDYLKKTGWDAFGLEISEKNAEFGIKEKKLNISVGTLKETSYPTEYFDVITLWEVIEHIADPIENIQKAYQLLRKGGLLALSTPNYNSLARFILRDKWSSMDPVSHLRLFMPGTVKYMLTKSGFKNIRIKTMDLNPYEILRLFKKENNYDVYYKDIKKIKNKIKKNKFFYYTRTILNNILGVIPVGDKMVVFAVKT
ncbi:MAG: class I SAM-dependent methyltransferase [Candidatus Firestonebacteria bacterium]|nr:class I SAM-dependent methyltransferase [Candidatus Firestonebacteria bacterium]